MSIERNVSFTLPVYAPRFKRRVLNISFCNFVFDLHVGDSGDSGYFVREKQILYNGCVCHTWSLFSRKCHVRKYYAFVYMKHVYIYIYVWVYVCIYVTYVQRDVIGDFDRKRFSAKK